MKTFKKLVLAAVVLPLTLGSVSAFANNGGKSQNKGPQGKCGGFDQGIMKKLDLTDAQKEQLKEMKKADREEMKAQRTAKKAQMQAGKQAQHLQAQELVLADSFDEAAANQLAQQMVEQQSERRVATLKKQHEKLSVLTAEQKEAFKELSEQRMTKCMEKKNKRMQDK
ncbi:stress adaptor protein CpxP [Vibrio sp. 10N.286.49.B3]|uniref:CpxP family protein n=1 Tax=Vibrio sp. 10N.286.49.B3 TaxID=1880855 RepID=UPI000C838736|nr:CpxP family protein [Vibrio sp. 10N.286.49.B3]PMH46249.1 stress adaptor protein CpxP [Vibrio sp. 10N.286.49.B3]